VQDGGFVGHAVNAGIESGKLAHDGGIVQRVFHGWIGEGEPLLHEMDAQHGFQRKRPPPATGLGVNRFDQRAEPLPGNDLFHLGQEQLTAGGLGLFGETGFGKAALFHDEICGIGMSGFYRFRQGTCSDHP